MSLTFVKTSRSSSPGPAPASLGLLVLLGVLLSDGILASRLLAANLPLEALEKASTCTCKVCYLEGLSQGRLLKYLLFQHLDFGSKGTGETSKRLRKEGGGRACVQAHMS